MVFSFLRSKVIVHKSCCPNKIVGLMSGIHESVVHSIQQSLFTTGDNGAKRYFSRQNFYLLMPRNLVTKAVQPLMRPKWWRCSSNLWILGACGLFTACFVRIEKIPFTGRFHVVLSEELMSTLAELHWKAFGRRKYTEKMLPSDHLASILAASIAEQMVEAMNARLMIDKQFKMNGRTYDGRPMICKCSPLLDESGKLVGIYDVVCRRDETPCKLIKTNVSQISQGQQQAWIKPATKHLNGRDWKVHVSDSLIYTAFCLMDQRIAVRRESIRSEEETAAIIGHEMGHAIARHSAEWFVMVVWSFALVSIIESWMLLFATVLMSRYLSRRQEVEADYIGLMLTASAGYDPRVAAKRRLGGGSGLLSTHPSGDVRAKLLNETKTMEKALEIYREVNEPMAEK